VRGAILLMAVAALAQAETGSFKIRLILHAVGEEKYEITNSPDGITLDTKLEYTDRGNIRTTAAKLTMSPDYAARVYSVAGRPDSVRVENGQATVQEIASSRTFAAPNQYVAIIGPTPFAIQMMAMRYWLAHGKPRELPMLRASAVADPLRIELEGKESITVGGKTIALERYTIANLMFGKEVVWMTADGNLAAAMTFAGGLPMEAVRSEFDPAFDQLYKSGVAQQMANLKSIQKAVPTEAGADIAILGARLISAISGTLPQNDMAVIVRSGKITAIGPRTTTDIPRGARVIDAKGLTILPGLWEMHTHFSGAEFGPALLAAGITTARDCGGEFDFLVAQRDAIGRHSAAAIAPRLLLAGLVDAGGIKAFGNVTAETRDQGREVAQRYFRAGFQQIKLYTFLDPDVVEAIAAEAHRYQMTVTGHVPQAMNAFQGVQAGMDQINHLNYVSTVMRDPAPNGNTKGGGAPFDEFSETAQKAIRFFRDHKTVVDPTAGWGEMSSHSKEVDVATFEPGILKSPFVLDAKYRGMGGSTTADQMHARMAQTLAVIGALFRGGVAIVPGSDTGLVGYGLHRELELYVQAGMTPFQAIQSATIVSARAMHLDKEVGTIEVGKRADLILVEGDPLADIKDLRKVSRVIANGRMYDPAKLWQSVGFRP
jgi:imidazolonepropionase-like amidohydrolase